MNLRSSIIAIICTLCMAFFSIAIAKQTDAVEVLNFADPMTESLLQAMNKDDYDKFSKDFSNEMRQALTEENYNKQIGTIKGKIGVYISGSKEFIGKQFNNQDILVNYKATFSEEADSVLVTVVFRHNAHENIISGLWFNSPKLRS